MKKVFKIALELIMWAVVWTVFYVYVLPEDSVSNIVVGVTIQTVLFTLMFSILLRPLRSFMNNKTTDVY
ncbi:MAG: hypothetical protein H6550_03020 [Chitinophagales bacterium]|nr:hypothetical protein [Chitinophagales bacterium]